eukprot:CAMPEP_0117021212 /NCGR_PEP_ID=MMETSP0472-20121206/16029_1 /TAXON_ID=693140 ORGANISM="Tiarina fusus, Strain LIS" /NCGR_SAMPLE_ID=MMETSP0472 /ASSEMBLY_ACC=CAM_ASM_000603 /LENGTH=537 /DNA_ID=CAMNT_0004726629 /DNA_START=99 /DNA_END=1712 /DNA_ORIENTATION=-
MRVLPSKELVLLLSLIVFSSSFSTCLASATSGNGSGPSSSFSDVVSQISRQGQATWSRSTNAVQQIMSNRGQATLTRSIPALSLYNGEKDLTRKTLEVSSVKRKRRRQLQIPKEQLKGGGFYYGVSTKTLTKASTPSTAAKKPKLSDSMFEALEELKYLRLEMETMRKEMQTLRQKMIEDGDLEENPEEMKAKQLAMNRKRQKKCEKLAEEIEEWAQQILRETEDDGWKQVQCSKMMKKSVNPTQRTTAYLKWMKDSRGDMAVKTDETEYPCIKCFSTIDAPLEDVCTYLSQESAAPEYNDVVVKYNDIEEISPNAKICWSQSPQILFLKPREFITFCHHRWKRDGTEVIVNQAWDHPDYPAIDDENTAGKSCRALALRGANFLSRDPDDPEKTNVILIAHANPGGNVPQWAARTAVNALTPIEPFKLFHKINEAVQKNQKQVRQRLEQAEMVSTVPPGRSPRPAGIAQMGYACFWPNGGGVDEGRPRKQKSPEQNTDGAIGSDNAGPTENENTSDATESEDDGSSRMPAVSLDDSS